MSLLRVARCRICGYETSNAKQEESHEMRESIKALDCTIRCQDILLAILDSTLLSSNDAGHLFRFILEQLDEDVNWKWIGCMELTQHPSESGST